MTAAASVMAVRAGKWIAVVTSLAVALTLLWAAASAHVTYACATDDTPYLPLCPAPPGTAEGVQEEMRNRIAHNPGDAWAWARLLVATREQRNEGVLRGAATLAPHHLSVLRLRAADALAQGRMEEGVAALMLILENRYSAEAAQAVAHLSKTPQGMALLEPHMRHAKLWLPRVLAVLPSLKIPPADALPLVAAALRHDALPEELMRAYMRSLKSNGLWHDAFGLWIASQKKEVPLLYNAGFDQPFKTDGFDWETVAVPRSRAGVLLAQETMSKRGMVLQMEFTGRGFTAPVVRQYVFAPPGSYRLRGEYLAPKLRSEQGLVWAVHCPATRKVISTRSTHLEETGGLWKSFEADFTVPPDCGPVVSVQLEPAAAFEAGAGLKGRLAIDNLALARVQD